jgi:hypothetical protein
MLQGAWLSQTLGYLLHQACGDEGLAFSHALLVMLTAGVLMLAVYRRGASALWAAAAGLALLVLDLPIVGTLRPQLFGQLGVALFLLAIAELPHRSRPLLWLPVVAALWANLHGSIIVGLAMLGIHTLGAAIDVFRQSFNLKMVVSDAATRRAAAALLLAAIAGCINPHGPGLYAAIAGFGNHPALASISEWRPLAPASLSGVLMIVSLIATAVAWKYSRRGWQISDLLLLAVFGLAMLTAMRMLAWWAIVWPFVVWPHLASLSRRAHAAPAGDTSDAGEPTSMRTVMALGFIFMTALVAPPTFSLVSGRARGEGVIMVADAPVYVADECVRRSLVGNIAAPPDWADYLIWKTDGQLRPLVHGHIHLADAATWRDFETIFRGDEGWLETLKVHQMQYVLVPRRRYSKLAKLVLTADRSGRGDLRIIYQDQRCLMAEVSL